MQFNKWAAKTTPEEIGGSFEADHGAVGSAPSDPSTEADELGLYETVPTVPRRHSLRYLAERLKLRQLAEERLIRLADELLKLATEVRYHDPLMAEVLDEAWISTDTALSLLEDE
ncbi:MAG: HEPN domain-containing protein [Leptolyngbyaceae cyanobacterium SL_7_1]|nr:HEPN domain-containing protein [Leptolyngbyaceae cyanobacterium SL_7_1]